ncbi:gliding motility protein MglA [hydrothermal vent metagenome]|uniref:Gliding motility protein MglA n=1 Tax=hydrothermal vent metagenome TaxID=652676 RepID=A0A3B1CND2_9ZZZZ
MALFNYATKEITLKVVYYGPGLSGKTTNLQKLHSVLSPERRGKLLSLATEADRTLFFDFMPVELGKIKDFSIRFQLYTVPGQVRYNATRKLVLKGADGVVFVADSQRMMREQNSESLANMRENLLANNLDPSDIPVIFQYNKRDLDDIMSVDELNRELNPDSFPYFEAVAIDGQGVRETFNTATKLILKYISRKHRIDVKLTEKVEKPVQEPPVAEPVVDPLLEPILEPVAEPAVNPLLEPALEQPAYNPAPRPAPAEPGGPDITLFLKDITSTLSELREQIERVEKSVDNSRDAHKEKVRYDLAVQKFDKAMSDIRGKQEKLMSMLQEIKASIDNAKTKKRWFFFG